MPSKQLLIPVVLLLAVIVLTASVSHVEPEPTYLGNLTQYFVAGIMTLYFVAILVYARSIMDALASYFTRHRGPQSMAGSTLAPILGYLIVIGSVLVLLRTGVLQRILFTLQNVASIVSNSAIYANGKPASTLPMSTLNPGLYYYTGIIFIAIIIFSLVLFFGGIRTAYSWTREDMRSANPMAARQEALGIVRRAAQGLRASGEYRTIVLRCYKQMCEMLSQDGLNIRVDETAREFSDEVSSKLRLGSDAVRSLTFLFEEARYSAHDIDEGKRAAALNELEILEHVLSGSES